MPRVVEQRVDVQAVPVWVDILEGDPALLVNTGTAAVSFGHAPAGYYPSVPPPQGKVTVDGTLTAGGSVTLSAGVWAYCASGYSVVVVTDDEGSFVNLSAGPSVAIDPGSPTTVGTSHAQAFAANPNRFEAGFSVNHDTAIVWVSRGGIAAVNGGEPVYPRTTFRETAGVAVDYVSDTASTPVSKWEV